MNKKGFVLAEAIIVAVFVLGMFSYLAINILPLISKYDKALDYDNPTEIYLVNDLYEELKIRGIKYDPQLGDYTFIKSEDTGQIDCKLNKVDHSKVFCSEDFKGYIYNHLKISEIYVINNKQDQDIVYKTNLSRAMREYYLYYINKNKTISDRVMLIKFQNGKFANITMEEDVDL